MPVHITGGRELNTLGHNIKLIPPQYVKPYVRGNKNDCNDALANKLARIGWAILAHKTVYQPVC